MRNAKYSRDPTSGTVASTDSLWFGGKGLPTDRVAVKGLRFRHPPNPARSSYECSGRALFGCRATPLFQEDSVTPCLAASAQKAASSLNSQLNGSMGPPSSGSQKKPDRRLDRRACDSKASHQLGPRYGQINRCLRGFLSARP